MGRQTQLHVLPKDLNDLLVSMHDKEPLEVALRIGNSASPQWLPFVPNSLAGQILALRSQRLAPTVERRYLPNGDSPYYLMDEQVESVFEFSLSGLTTWEGRPALTQGRIYGVFQNKGLEFEKCYEQIIRYIRRYWSENPVKWLGGYVGPAARQMFEQGGLLLPNYIPPLRGDWIQRLGEQHPQ